MTRKQINALRKVKANLEKEAKRLNDVMYPSELWDKVMDFVSKTRGDADLYYKDFNFLRDAHDSITYACDLIERVINKQQKQ